MSSYKSHIIIKISRSLFPKNLPDEATIYIINFEDCNNPLTTLARTGII